MKGPKRLLARHGAQSDEERNGRTPVRKLVATFCAVAMSVGMAGVSMSAYADDQQPAEDATTTVEATPEAQPSEDATVDAQPEAEATDAAQDAAADTSETTTESADAAQTMPETASDQNDEVVPPVMRAAPAVVADTKPAPPTGTKYITSNDDNDYTLHVALTGSNETGTTQATPVNVAFVLDSSGSMQGNRWKMATNAVKTMSRRFLTENKDNRVAVIRYASTLGDTTSFTDSMTAINKVLSDSPGGGTNWEAGLKAANALKPTAGAKKYIIFISDGQPTYRLDPMGCSTSSWWFEPECDYDRWNGIWGEGNADTNGLNLRAAEKEANARGNVPLYAVRVDNDTTTRKSMNAFAENTNAVTKASYDGTSETALDNAFKDIYQSITTSAQTKILTLTDTLSEWVTPTQWDPTFTGDVTQFVKVKGPDGDLQTTAYSAKYDAATRKVTVTFKNGGVIATASQTYTMRFDVAPSQQAFDQWASNANSDKSAGDLYQDATGSTSTGGADTGPTSDGMPGFVSNAGASASYQVCTTTTTSTGTSTECDASQEYKAYETPVVQTKFKDATTAEDALRVQKTVEGSKGWDVKDTFQFTIAKAADTPDNTPLPQDTTLTVSKDGDSNTATGNFGQITYDTPGTYRYTVSEVKGNGSYQYSQAAYLVTVKVTADGNSKSLVAAIDSVQQTKDADTGADLNPAVPSQMPMAFVNQNAMVTLDAKTIGVKKTVNGTDTDQAFAFTMTATGGNAGDVKWPNNQASSTLKITGRFTNGEPKEAKFADALEFPVPSSKNETATYRLQVMENDADNPPAGWNYDKSVKTVTVTVKYDKTQSKWIATADPAIVDFTNTWVAVSNLPLTGEGGATPMLWLAIGGGLGALALLAAGGAAIWRKRRLI